MFGSTSKVSERVKLDNVKGIGSLPKPSDKPLPGSLDSKIGASNSKHDDQTPKAQRR
jgi:hypothetical protein